MEIYIVKNKTQMGPYDIGKITQMLQSGVLEKYDLYWHEGMMDWAPVGGLIHKKYDENRDIRVRNPLGETSIIRNSGEIPKDDVTKNIITAIRVCLGISLLGPILLGNTLLGIIGLYFSFPFASVAFILGIVVLIKGKTTEGIISIILSLICPMLGWGICLASLAFYLYLFHK
jgi:hypothetical protein